MTALLLYTVRKQVNTLVLLVVFGLVYLRTLVHGEVVVLSNLAGHLLIIIFILYLKTLSVWLGDVAALCSDVLALVLAGNHRCLLRLE